MWLVACWPQKRRTEVICDIDAQSCGETETDFGTLFNSSDYNSTQKAAAMPASEGGLQGECLSDKVCILMSEVPSQKGGLAVEQRMSSCF